MRRKDREITDFSEIMKIVDACDILRIGLSDGDFPYIVPVNFGYYREGGKLSFIIHGACAGRKYELLKKNPLCSFEMDIPLNVERMEDVKEVTQRYKSVMGRAKAVFLEGEEKKTAIDEAILGRIKEAADLDYNPRALSHTAVIRLEVLEIIGKASLSK